MHKLWLIIKREYLTRVKKKSFIIVTLLTPLGFALLMFFSGFMASGKMILIGSVAQIKEDYKENKYRLVTNRDITQYLEPAGVQIESQKENDYIVKFSDYNSNAFLSNLINDDIKIISFNEILPSINEIFIKKVNEN